MTVNDAVAKRISKLLCEKGITQYQLEQNSGVQHGSLLFFVFPPIFTFEFRNFARIIYK